MIRLKHLLSTLALMAYCITGAHATEFKVGLLTSGSVAESGWNSLAYEALLDLEKKVGAKISNVELGNNPSTYEKVFRDYANQDYQVVIGHGYEFEDAALQVGPDYPDTIFLISSSFAFEDNVIGANLYARQAFYLLGVIAAGRSNKVGYIGGMDIPPIRHGLEALIAGGKSVNPALEVSSIFTGNFSDSAATKEAAINMLANGIQVIVTNADAANHGALQAVHESNNGAVSIGAFGDWSEASPSTVIANFAPNMAAGMVEVVGNIKQGNFEQKSNILWGMESSDVMKITYNEKADNPVTEKTRNAITDLANKLIEGSISPE